MILHRAAILAWIMWDASSFFEWLAARPWYLQVLCEWVAIIPIAAGDQVLEVGCGPGLLTRRLQASGAEVMGLDRSAAMVQRARKNVPECLFIAGDALAIPLENDLLDVVCAASVVNVVSEPETLVREMARVARSGGVVSVLFPTPNLEGSAGAMTQRHGLSGLSAGALAIWAGKAPKREPGQIQALFETHGLSDVRVDWFFEGTVASVTGRVR